MNMSEDVTAVSMQVSEKAAEAALSAFKSVLDSVGRLFRELLGMEHDRARARAQMKAAKSGSQAPEKTKPPNVSATNLTGIKPGEVSLKELAENARNTGEALSVAQNGFSQEDRKAIARTAKKYGIPVAFSNTKGKNNLYANVRSGDLPIFKQICTECIKHEDINAYLHTMIAKRIERPFDEMPKYRIGDFTVSVELRPGEMDQAMLAVKGQRDPSYSIPLGSAANADNWQRIVNFLDGSIEKAIEDSNAKITKLETDLKQAQERVGVPFDGEEELLKAKIDFAELEARLSGLSEQQDAIIDPDETDDEESAEKRAEREAYQNADDDGYPMIPDDNALRHGPRR